MAMNDWMPRLAGTKDRLTDLHDRLYNRGGAYWRYFYLLGLIPLLLCLVLMFYWDTEPELFDVRQSALAHAKGDENMLVPGFVTSIALVEVVQTMMDKPGGYMSNDVMPPSVFMDNIPSWEFGVLVQSRDLARAFRNQLSRSQSQSVQNEFLSKAEPMLNFSNDSWMFPPTESEYRQGLELLTEYAIKLADKNHAGNEFYARADNLREWLSTVEVRLGSMSQRLSASVGQRRLNTDLAGDAEATQSTNQPSERDIKTPWLEIDDVFYEARGMTWALIHFLRAVEIDFRDVLLKKNALVSLRQIVRELEATQETVWAPMILNGSGLGLVTNHSLVMASYISRANAAVIDLRALLARG